MFDESEARRQFHSYLLLVEALPPESEDPSCQLLLIALAHGQVVRIEHISTQAYAVTRRPHVIVFVDCHVPVACQVHDGQFENDVEHSLVGVPENHIVYKAEIEGR